MTEAQGSVGLLGHAIHNLSDVSASVVALAGFRLSKWSASERYPYGLETGRAPGRDRHRHLLGEQIEQYMILGACNPIRARDSR
jgi:hypothetical protein